MFEWLKPKPKINEFDKQLLASNLVGAKSLEQLSERERLVTDSRTRELKSNPIKGNFDYEHLKEINKYLFKDVYVWAGMDRYDIGIRGDFRKGDTHFTPGDKLPEVSKSLFDALQKENYFKDLSKDDFTKSAASFMNGLNMLHPFREGNGRTQRIYIEELANHAGYNLDLSKASKSMTIQASILAGKGHLQGLEKIINENISGAIMTKEEEQKMLNELGIEKSPMLGKCGTYRMPNINLGENQSTITDDKIENKSTCAGGVFDSSTYEGDDIPLDLPAFISVQHD